MLELTRSSSWVLSLVMLLREGVMPEVQRVIDTLQNISTFLMVLAWVMVGIGWFAGWFKIALPVPSRRIKSAGHEEVETAGLAAFFIAIFFTLLTAITWIVKAIGGATAPPPPL
jgi:hypothetical protein